MPWDYDPSLLVPKGMERDSAVKALREAHTALEKVADFGSNDIEDALRTLTGELGVSGRQLFSALRVATTGRTATPPLFDTMEILGRDRCLKRIQRAAEMLEEQ